MNQFPRLTSTPMDFIFWFRIFDFGYYEIVSNFGFRDSNLNLLLTLLTEMILEGETPSPRPVFAAISAEEKIIPAGWTIIISDMSRMGFRTSLFSPCQIKTEVFSALMAEFKEVLIQESATDLTIPDLHNALKNKGSRVQGFKYLMSEYLIRFFIISFGHLTP